MPTRSRHAITAVVAAVLVLACGWTTTASAAVLPAISVTPSSKNFGNQHVNTTSAAQTFTITNTGGGTLNLTSETIIGPHASLFGISNNTCNASALAMNASCTLDVKFFPTSGGAKSATLRIVSNDPTSPTDVALSGTGIEPLVTVTPSSKAFGIQGIGTQSAAQSFTVTNSGTDNLNLTGESIVGPDQSQFTISTSTCTFAPIAPNGSCTIDVKFVPTATGAKTASLQVTSDAFTSPDDFSLTGTGTKPGIGVSPSSKAFGNQDTGTTSTAQAFTVTNTGSDPLQVGTATLTGANASDFALSANTCNGQTVAAGGSCTVSVAFAPATAGAKSATLRITSDASATPTDIALTGTGTTPPGPTPTPTPTPTPLTLTSLVITPKTFPSGSSATVAFRLSRPAVVGLHIDRVLIGRTRGGRCVVAGASRKTGTRCVRYDDLGKIDVNGVAGTNSVKFNPALGGTALPAGRYRLRAIATDGAERTPAVAVRFRLT